MKRLIALTVAMTMLLTNATAFCGQVNLKSGAVWNAEILEVGSLGITVECKAQDVPLELRKLLMPRGDASTAQEEKILRLFIPWVYIGGNLRAGDIPRGQSEQGTQRGMQVGECLLRGKDFAEHNINTDGSAVLGFCSELLFGIVGAGLAYALTDKPCTPAEMLIGVEDDNCKLAMIEGFKEKGKSMKRSAVLTGGVVGTVLLVGLYVYSQNQ